MTAATSYPQGTNTTTVRSEVGGNTPPARLQNLLQKQMVSVNELMLNAAASKYAPLIPQIIQHLTIAGGKRIRPLMTLAAASIIDDNSKAAYLAAAVECIHSATLLHDDVIDESLTRRGSPTANSIWGNKPSILVGDYLFSQAFRLMVEAGSMQALAVLADTAAVIAESEVWQLQMIGDMELTWEAYLKLIEAKTASLFAAACEVGALAAGAPDDLVANLRQYGWAFGMIFQIIDDVLDYTADNPKFGKAKGGDFYEGKVTVPVLMLRNSANAQERKWLNEVFSAPKRDEHQLAHLLELLHKYGAEEAARAMSDNYVAKGYAAAEKLPKLPIVDLLVELLEYTANRQY